MPCTETLTHRKVITMRKSLFTVGAAFAFSLLLAAPADAQVHFGPQASFADDADFGIGARVVAGVPDYAGFEAVGSFDYYFPDGFDYWELNGNVLYNFELEGESSVRPYAGGGLNIARFESDVDDVPGVDVDTGNTEVGLNLVGGTKFATDATTTPFVEAKFEVSGGEQFVIQGGLLF